MSVTQAIARLALGKLRDKETQLIEALTGFFTEHHAFLTRTMLQRTDAATATITDLTNEIDRRLQPYRRQIELLTTVPGISLTAPRSWSQRSAST